MLRLRVGEAHLDVLMSDKPSPLATDNLEPLANPGMRRHRQAALDRINLMADSVRGQLDASSHG